MPLSSLIRSHQGAHMTEYEETSENITAPVAESSDADDNRNQIQNGV